MFECPACGDEFDSTHGLCIHTSRWCENATEEDKEYVAELNSGDNHPSTGHTMPEEAKKQLSEKRKGEKNPMHGKTGEDNPFYGRTHSEESIKQMKKNTPDYSGSDNPNFRHGKYLERHCKECGELFKPSRAEQNYCSEECMGNAFTKPTQQKMCKFCGSIFTPNNPNIRYCSVTCSNKDMAKDSDMPGFYWAVRQSLSDIGWSVIREREVGEKCKICGCEDNLHVHHIIPVLSGGLNESWNLITLCSSCHKNVEYYTDAFTEKTLLPND